MDDMLDKQCIQPRVVCSYSRCVPKRIIVMDISKDENKKEPMYFVNPILKIKIQLNHTYEEGCLSVPNQFAEIDRPSKCEIEYLDYNGEKILKAEWSISYLDPT